MEEGKVHDAHKSDDEEGGFKDEMYVPKMRAKKAKLSLNIIIRTYSATATTECAEDGSEDEGCAKEMGEGRDMITPPSQYSGTTDATSCRTSFEPSPMSKT